MVPRKEEVERDLGSFWGEFGEWKGGGWRCCRGVCLQLLHITWGPLHQHGSSFGFEVSDERNIFVVFGCEVEGGITIIIDNFDACYPFLK